jgi:cell division protein FtsL
MTRPHQTPSLFSVLRAQISAPLVLIGLLATLVIVSAMSVIWASYQVRMARAQVEALEKQRDELDNEFRELRIAQAVLAEHSRVEDLAAAKLRMERVNLANERVVESDELAKVISTEGAP